MQPTHPTSQTSEPLERVTLARQEAEAICLQHGEGSPECQAAWASVKKLENEVSDQTATVQYANLEAFCEANPGAVECLIYEE